MKHVSILVLKEAIISSIDAPRQIFTKVNEFLVAKGKSPAFHVELVSNTNKTSINNDTYAIRCDHTLDEVLKTDLIIIPMLCNGFPNAIEKNSEFAPWIIDQYKNNAEIACLCSGSFFLASTGLLDNNDCAVHWGAANEFRTMFPGINVIDEKLITHERGIYTCGGNYSYLNLILYLIEKYADREMAVFVAKMFEIEIDRKSQAPFTIFMGQKNHEDEPVKRAQEYIENNYNDKITIDQLTGMLALSRRNFERRFKKATSNTIVEYMQRVKIEAVKKGLETGRKTINDLMYDVGYSDIKAFRTIFKKITGLSPVEYRSKYAIDAVSMF